MIHKTFTADFPKIDYLTWLFRQRVYYENDDPVFVDTESPSNFVTYGEMLDSSQRIARSLREVEGIGINGPGKDVVVMYSTNQVRSLHKWANDETDYVSCCIFVSCMRRRCVQSVASKLVAVRCSLSNESGRGECCLLFTRSIDVRRKGVPINRRSPVETLRCLVHWEARYL